MRFSCLILVIFVPVILFLSACQAPTEKEETETVENSKDDIQIDRFADVRILKYEISGWDELTLDQKKLCYYLSEASLSGRDIIWDQNHKNNLKVRRTIEAIIDSYDGKRVGDEWDGFMEYAKCVWFANGIHHHYAKKKFSPDFSAEYFEKLVRNSQESRMPLENGESIDDMLADLTPVIFDPTLYTISVNQKDGVDMVAESANNYYEGLTQGEVEEYYSNVIDKNEPNPISYGLNSKLVKENGQIVEKAWRVGGMYSPAIERICYWLDKAIEVAENDTQKECLELLMEYYETGDLKTFDAYNLVWIRDTSSVIDWVNGFIEVYGDPLGYRGAYEAVLSIKDFEASKRIEAIGKEAQWFEDNSSIMDEHKKADVVGISAKVITVVQESGDCSPSSPIGINLPNANWIRQRGSKSVSLGNITNAYNMAKGGSVDEFAYNDEEKERAKEWGSLAGKLHTDMHEVIGHASGVINDGIGTPKETLKSYASTLEEARADLVSLYFMIDPKLQEIGVMPSVEVGKAEYDSYVRNGLMLQLRRIEPGEDIQEAHMRNRQLNAMWAYEKGLSDNVIEKKVENGKTYFVINDYEKLRVIWGELLKEIQRIKSEGDYEAGRALVENYGVKVDKDLHTEVLERYKKLGTAPYSGFVNPVIKPVMKGDEIVDVVVEYPNDFVEQMMYYAKNYSFLPTVN